jgi:D-aminopeptidase
MCMAGPMTGINGHTCPALPLDEVRRFVALFQAVLPRRRRPGPQSPVSTEERSFTLAEARPTAVRSAEGIPFPTKPAP